ncbi:MAG: hypothetical protein ACPGGH_07770, partial [Chitinophagales bacterium]
EILDLTFPDTGTYTIQLIAYNDQGCSDTMLQNVVLSLPTSLTAGNTTQGKEIILENQRVFIHNNATVIWAAIDGKKVGSKLEDYHQLSPGIYLLIQTTGYATDTVQRVVKF